MAKLGGARDADETHSDSRWMLRAQFTELLTKLAPVAVDDLANQGYPIARTALLEDIRCELFWHPDVIAAARTWASRWNLAATDGTEWPVELALRTLEFWAASHDPAEMMMTLGGETWDRISREGVSNPWNWQGGETEAAAKLRAAAEFAAHIAEVKAKTVPALELREKGVARFIRFQVLGKSYADIARADGLKSVEAGTSRSYSKTVGESVRLAAEALALEVRKA